MDIEKLLLPRKAGVCHYRHGYKTAGKYSSEYSIWSNIRARCNNPNNPNFERYGARGISVCDRWMVDFLNFLEDMGRRPSLNHSIERVDNDGNYTPDNCKWATRKEQARNRRSSRFITFADKTQTLAAWAEEIGIPMNTLHLRLKYAWTLERAMTQPLRITKSTKGKV